MSLAGFPLAWIQNHWPDVVLSSICCSLSRTTDQPHPDPIFFKPTFHLHRKGSSCYIQAENECKPVWFQSCLSWQKVIKFPFLTNHLDVSTLPITKFRYMTKVLKTNFETSPKSAALKHLCTSNYLVCFNFLFDLFQRCCASIQTFASHSIFFS